MIGGWVKRTDRAVRKFCPKGVRVRLPEPAPLAAPAQTSGVNQAPTYGDTIVKRQSESSPTIFGVPALKLVVFEAPSV
jgi:hypothetical protein